MTICYRDMPDLAELGAFAADVEPGDRRGVAARFDGEFFVAVQDPVVAVFDDDGNEFPDVAGAELDGLAVDHDPAAGVHAPLSTAGSGGQRRRGQWGGCGPGAL